MTIKHNNDILFFNGNDKKYAYYCTDGINERKAKLQYRHERTWDDHMGNTSFGYYFIAIWSDHSKQRVYLCDVM